MENETVSLISVSGISLLVCRNATDFCTFILYFATFPNSLMTSSSFLVVSLRFSTYNIISSANNDSFISPFPIWIYLCLFILWLLCIGLPKLCRIKMVRVGIPVLFLILEEIVSAFHHWEWCLLWVCHICSLLCWDRFPLCSFSGEFYHKWVLHFVKSFYSLYWHDHMDFSLQFVNVMYHIGWFMHIEESLHPWNKSDLVMVYDHFDVL